MADGEFGDVADVSHSSAFLTLESLVEQKKLVDERSIFYKEKYKQLHDRVLQIYQNDNFLLKRAKIIRKELDNEKAKVDKCGEVAKDDDATIQKLKRELAIAENDLSVAQEKESMLQVESFELHKRKTTLQNEVDDAIAEEEARMRPAIEEMNKNIQELKDEIELTSDKFDKLKVDREEALKKDKDLRETMDAQDVEIYDRKLELTKLDREPDRAKKQADIVEKATQTAHKELNTLIDKLKLLNNTIKEHEEKRKNMEEQRYELALTYETQRTAIEQREKMMDAIERNLESEKDSNFKLVQTSSSLEANLKNISLSLSKEKDALNKVIKEKEAGLKQFRRIEQAKHDLIGDRDTLSKQKEILMREVNRIKKSRRKLKDELEELKRDVDILINNFLKEEIHEKQQSDVLLSLLKHLKTLDKTVAQKAEDEQANQRVITELSVHRENKSRDASKNKAKVLQTRDDLKVKEVIIKELQKRNTELLSRLQQLTEMYSGVKRERSNKAALIQSASQAMSETQEKIKILENELEVLRRESLLKDKLLVKLRRDLHDERTNCENLRVESNKLYTNYKQKKKSIQEQCSQINKLNTVINVTEEEMLQLKKKYEEAVEDRNFTGIQLIDRNDELCILYEKCNIQENILKTGQLELNAREQEIRGMAISLGDLQREIEICQKQLPKVKEYEDEVAQLHENLEDERWRVELLEDDLVDPRNETRWRKLGTVKKGPNAADPEAHETLLSKEQELEQKLYREHEKLMEKELILEEVSELSDRLRKQAVNGRDYTLELAKKVNSYQFSIKQKTKKMMATLSELSVVQATSIKMENDVNTVLEQTEEARQRLESGLPPTETAELEFQKAMRDREKKQQTMLELSQRRQEEMSQPAQIMRTTAESRPNAYIPDQELMLPKPYGLYQPFKPVPASHAAHKYCRKPVPQEVEL
eukprot:NODE_166_length_3074_cov_85.501864_g153_i0.p1 GENE.NODE_166_length_3074_cov_85.501864_g153_i0~~NODE_166_length_3074_cov_85.501864_g153_i0.p1  ORF type:complete len:935 (+),score=319.38 NODE_166_length_3074_cov_85.501864_g153_i0:91-2895(+)